MRRPGARKARVGQSTIEWTLIVCIVSIPFSYGIVTYVLPATADFLFRVFSFLFW